MKNVIKSLLLLVFCLQVVNASAQTEQVKISGLVSEKKNVEITIQKSSRLVECIVDTVNNNFSFSLPAGDYSMKITVMKAGHRRLETDYYVTFPLKLEAKKNLSLIITPSQLNQEKKTGLVYAKQPVKLSTASINGCYSTSKFAGNITISRAEEGRLKSVQTSFIQKADSSFSLQIPVEKEGFYSLSGLTWEKNIYLKPNDHLQLVLDTRSGLTISETLATEENQVLQQWEQLINPLHLLLKTSKLDRELFTTTYQALQPKINQFVQQVKTPNASFNALFKIAARLDNNMIAFNFLLKTASVNRGPFSLMYKEFVNVPDYYKQTLKANTINSADLLKFGEGNMYINWNAKMSLTNMSETESKQLGDAEKVKILMDSTPNDTLKAYLLKSQLEELEISVGNYSEFRDTFLPYRKYTKPASVRQKFNNIYNSYAADTAFIGKSSYDFTLPDVNGKMVNMRDFQGKVVLIDVWATWCGPCKAQMPFLKEVEEHYKGNENVVFVGISLDAEKDKQKWMDMVTDKKLEGVQLLDAGWKAFAKKYKITAIPRFLLIDKKGNWSEIRCPMPENKEKLIKYIDRELQRAI